MPLVITQKIKETIYKDDVGKNYEFPEKYLTLLSIGVGEKLIYYRPKEGNEGKNYFGCGKIASIKKSSQKTVHITIGEYRKFNKEVPIRNEDGKYIETGDESLPFFRWSVRRIHEDDYSRITSMGI